jgi:hypothetical protein
MADQTAEPAVSAELRALQAQVGLARQVLTSRDTAWCDVCRRWAWEAGMLLSGKTPEDIRSVRAVSAGRHHAGGGVDG